MTMLIVELGEKVLGIFLMGNYHYYMLAYSDLCHYLGLSFNVLPDVDLKKSTEYKGQTIVIITTRMMTQVVFIIIIIINNNNNNNNNNNKQTN